ncbi:MAG: response regulator [Pseudomonadota bacterium]
MKKVLIVEDDKRIADALSYRMMSLGFQVDKAHDAATAPMHARDSTPDLVLLDISMPGGNGFIVFDRIRALPSAQQTPVIFMTADQTPGLKEKAMSLGAAGFLEKPFGASRLIETVEAVMDPI